MATLTDIFQIIKQIRDDLPALISRVKIVPNQIAIVTGLSDIAERLGLVQAGEFRAGNSKEPGFGFSGVRMGYPAFTYDSETWNIVGVENDTLQFGLRASDGKAVAGGGAVIQGGDGIQLPDGGDAIELIDSSSKIHAIISLTDSYSGNALKSLKLFSYKQSSDTNQLTNGDFEAGSLSSWTEVDTGSKISISEI